MSSRILSLSVLAVIAAYHRGRSVTTRAHCRASAWRLARVHRLNGCLWRGCRRSDGTIFWGV